jgi:hypothetical protein
MDQRHADGIKRSIEDIIGTDTSIKVKKKSEDDFQREKFIKIITLLEETEVRGVLLGNDLQLDFSSYDEKFYTVIDNLLLMLFGKEACELIFFYLYDRINPDGTINELIDADDKVIVLTSPNELWELVKLTSGKVGKGKKK